MMGEPSDWLVDDLVREQLREVDERIRRIACGDDDGDQLPPFHEQLVSLRSKRLRPLFLLLAARFGSSASPDAVVRAGAALELVHEATLYHDDIVDEADTRRGRPSVTACCGTAVAASAGSALLYEAAALAADFPDRLRAEIARTGRTLCRALIAEVESTDSESVDVGARTRIMLGKTAPLFMLGVHLGAQLTDASVEVQQGLGRFALRFGLIFQLTDDIRDVLGGWRSLGRLPGADIRNGTLTLPILFALRECGDKRDEFGVALRAASGSGGRRAHEQVLAYVAEFGGIDQSRSLLSRWLQSARDELARLSDAGPEPAWRSFSNLLKLLAGQAVDVTVFDSTYRREPTEDQGHVASE